MENLSKVMNVFLELEQECNKETPYDSVYFLKLGVGAYYKLQEEVYKEHGIPLEEYDKTEGKE